VNFKSLAYDQTSSILLTGRPLAGWETRAWLSKHRQNRRDRTDWHRQST